MITLYTSVGQYHIRKSNNQKQPVIVMNGNEHVLDTHEMILWSTLAWNILTFDELEETFYKKERELHIISDLDFEYYLKRLAFRGLIATGCDCTGIDALYDLLGKLYVKPATGSFFIKLTTFLRLILKNWMPISKAGIVFSKDKITCDEKTILDLSRQRLLSTAEIIQCIDKKPYQIIKQNGFMKCSYDKVDTDNIVNESRFHYEKNNILSAVTNLYLKKLIRFEGNTI